MIFSWKLPCLLTVVTFNLVQAEISGTCNNCDSSNAWLDVTEQMIEKAKTCASNKCDSSTVYLEVSEQMVKKAKASANNKYKCDCSTVYLDVTEQIIKEATNLASNKCDITTICLDVAQRMIEKAETECSQPPFNFQPMDCSDVLQAGHNESGVYKVWPRSRVMADGSLDVYCDMDTDGGGWTVIQRRGNYSRSADYFYKDWESYKKGFGNIEEDFWLGNDAIHALSTQRQTSVRFDLEDVEGTRKYALYDDFSVDNEWNTYKLHVSDYSGDAGDSFASHHNSQMFSTIDRDNDAKKSGSCSQKFKGGWWYGECYHSNLNGLYQPGKYTGDVNRVTWNTFKGINECLKTTQIKLRPRHFGRRQRAG